MLRHNEEAMFRQPHGKLFSRVLRAYFNASDHPAKLRLWAHFRRLSGYRRLTIPYADGGYLAIDERDFLQRRILITGAYEPEVWECLASASKSQEIFWDVGAHIGAMSVKAVRDKRFVEVHSFEPDPAQAAVLKRNLILNGCKGTVHNVALSDVQEEELFYRATGSNSGISSLRPFAAAKEIEVRCASIDHLIFVEGVTPPTLMKIDVEGWEFRVFQGARRMLSECPPRMIVFESAADKDGSIVSKGIQEYLACLRYQLHWLRRPSGEIDANENYVAVLGQSVLS